MISSKPACINALDILKSSNACGAKLLPAFMQCLLHLEPTSTSRPVQQAPVGQYTATAGSMMGLFFGGGSCVLSMCVGGGARRACVCVGGAGVSMWGGKGGIGLLLASVKIIRQYYTSGYTLRSE